MTHVQTIKRQIARETRLVAQLNRHASITHDTHARTGCMVLAQDAQSRLRELQRDLNGLVRQIGVQ